jgi:hypothetical protein
MHWQLQTLDGAPVPVDFSATSFRGESAIIQGGRPPEHAGSTGRVYTREGLEYFPSVFGLRWVRTD